MSDPGPIARLDRLPIWPYPRRVLAVIGAAYFFAFFDVVNIGAALPAIARHFDITSGHASIAISLGLAGYVVGAFADSWVSDRIGRRQALFVSVALFSIGTLIAALAPSFELLVIGRFIAGMGIGAEIAAAAAYLAGISPAHLRGRAGSIAVAWAFVGFAVVPFVALLLVPNFADGWRYLFLIGGIGGLIVLPFRRHLPDSPRWLLARGDLEGAERGVAAAEAFVAAAPGAAERSAPPTPEPAQPRPFAITALLFTAIWFAYYIGNYGWLTLAPTLLTKEGFSLSASLGFLSVTGIGFVVGAVLAIRLSERVERKHTIIGTLAVYAAALLLIGLVPDAPVIVVAGFVVSLTIGLVIPIMYVYTAEHFTSGLRARGIAIGDGLGHLGGAIVPWIVLPAAAVGFVWGMTAMAVSGVVALVLVLFGRRMTGRTIA